MVTQAFGVIMRWFVGVCVKVFVRDRVSDCVVGMSNVPLELIGRGAWCPRWDTGNCLCVYICGSQAGIKEFEVDRHK